MPGNIATMPLVLSPDRTGVRVRSDIEYAPGVLADIDTVIARAGRDFPELNASVEAFVSEAMRRNLEMELMTHPDGQHSFDMLNDDDRSRAIIRRTIEFIREHSR